MPTQFSNLDGFFSANGKLAQNIPDYSPRSSQIAMASAVAKSIAENTTLVCEAGTGTGKTFAYLVPSIISAIEQEKRIIISTGTKNLQDQLFLRDLPNVLKILNKSIIFSQIKGRSNYLCLARLEDMDKTTWQDTELVSLLNYIKRSHRQTQFGELSEFVRIEEKSTAWKLVTSTQANCLAQNCDNFDDCYLYKARERALVADIVIVNHHLLMADLLLKQEGRQALLADFDACIVDEAHQLADVASGFFSLTLSAAQIKTFLKDSLKANIKEAGEKQQLQQHIELMQQQLDEINYIFIQYADNKQAKNNNWSQIKQALNGQFSDFHRNLSRLIKILESLALLGKELNNCYQRSQTFLALFSHVFEAPASSDTLYWYETNRSGFLIHITPLDIAEQFRQHTQQQQLSWIYTSATLSSLNNFKMSEQISSEYDISGHFQFFSQQLGLEESHYLSLPSPFDYARQALFYHPPGLPEPASADFISRLVTEVVPVLERLKGKTFMLFTSYRAMYEAHSILSGFDFNILLQGNYPKQQMLERFVSNDNSILLGTNSFWQGVDVPGPALSCVIIEKLPFASPYEPVTAAKLEMLKNQQQQPFYAHQIPQAIISLKQGIGRLIRSLSDYGVLIIGDRRLYTKNYGKIFRDVIPEMPSTHSFDEVDEFLSRHERKNQSVKL